MEMIVSTTVYQLNIASSLSTQNSSFSEFADRDVSYNPLQNRCNNTYMLMIY